VESFIVGRDTEFLAQGDDIGVDLEGRDRCGRQAPVAEPG
jgi:hypothetical protein